MTPIKVILNPVAGRGFSLKAEPNIVEYLKEAGLEFDLVETKEKGHGIELAEQAALDGFGIVVGAGGDGTTNEVVNGLMNAAARGKEAVLGLLATGTGSDFTFNVGMPTDLREACLRIKNGQTRRVDIGKFTVPGQPPRYFDNQLGIGFDGTVTVVAKRFKHLRGMALYLPVVLNSIFVTNKATRVTVETDGEKFELSSLQISVVNGAREGGGFFMAPDAKVDDGLFDVVVLEEVGKLAMLALVPKFMSGTHVNHEKVKVIRTKRVKITSPDVLTSHFDGELLIIDSHEIACELLPQSLSVIC
jgi:diacylglycerol kinase (ATP)